MNTNIKQLIDQYRGKTPTDKQLDKILDKVSALNLSPAEQAEVAEYMEKVFADTTAKVDRAPSIIAEHRTKLLMFGSVVAFIVGTLLLCVGFNAWVINGVFYLPQGKLGNYSLLLLFAFLSLAAWAVTNQPLRKLIVLSVIGVFLQNLSGNIITDNFNLYRFTAMLYLVGLLLTTACFFLSSKHIHAVSMKKSLKLVAVMFSISLLMGIISYIDHPMGYSYEEIRCMNFFYSLRPILIPIGSMMIYLFTWKSLKAKPIS